MRFSTLRSYVVLVCGAAIGSVFLLDWGSVLNLPRPDLFGLAALVVLGLLSESLSVPIAVGTYVTASSITFIPLLACVLLFGPAASVLFMALTGGFSQVVVHRKESFRAAFNVAQWIVATTTAGGAFAMAGGSPLEGSVSVTSLAPLAVPFVVFGIVFLGTNHIFVTLFIVLKEHMRFKRVLSAVAGSSGSNLLYDLLVSPVAIAVALLYSALSVGGLLLILLPMLFIRHSYLTNLRLQQANRDLLYMMVKAIETRDPYTSGHSRRVALLARRIGESLRLPSKTCESIETAALLHDIGKIDAAYVEILRKPSQLSPEERRVIQAHAVKGAELIESLSSFGKNIIAAVRHHHERYDGNGYPDGLSAQTIPLGARIIMICDSVDAMLSDRPYRRALSLRDVQEQLYLGKSTQFDPAITSSVMASTLLQEHYEEVFAQQARAAQWWERSAASVLSAPSHKAPSVREETSHISVAKVG